MRPARTSFIFSLAYLGLGLAWVLGANPPGAADLYFAWFLAIAIAGIFIAGIANQVTLARAYLAAPALAYSLSPGHLGLLAVVLGTIARRFGSYSTLGGGLDPVVDGVLLGAVAVGLVGSGIIPLWLAVVIVARYVLPAIGGLVLISLHRRPELRHTVTGQISTALIIVLIGGICLFRFFNQDTSNVVTGAEIVLPIATVATFVHLGWVARKPSRPAAAPEAG